MTEAAAASATPPASAGSPSAAPTKSSAPKDRTCPYCHVNFTSSSLGRHLDQYIKEKNPKAYDGIHNVDEIRESRGAITRRQVRSSAKRKHADGGQRPLNDGGSSNGASPSTAPDARKNGTQYLRQLFNTPHWTSTGVITDSDANIQFMGAGSGAAAIDAGKETPSTPLFDAATRRKWAEERERGRAAELALQEVLDSIKAAKPEREKPEIYDFDFFAQSFPSLCLRLLPAPPTMHMATLIPDPDAWPIEPPTQVTFTTLRRKVALHLLKWREEYFPPNPAKRPRSSSGRDAPPEPHELAIEPIPLYTHHLNAAFTSWNELSAGGRAREWHVEIMRAFAWERQEHKKTQSRIHYLETELARARLDNARLTECQMPREWLHTPASQLPVARLVAERVERQLTRDGLDAEKLIEKWRPQVQAVRNLSRKLDADEREAGRLVMMGPAGRGARPSGSLSYDGRIPDEGEDEEDGNDEDEEDDEGEGGVDEREEEDLYAASRSRPRAIEPSLRSQMANFAERNVGGN